MIRSLLFLFLGVGPDSLEQRIQSGDIESVEQDIQSLPEGVAFRYRGRLALQVGEYKVAAEAFEEAIKRDPGALSLRLYLAQVYLKLGQPRAALKEVDFAVGLKTETLAYSLLRARALEDMDKMSAALETLNDAQAIFSNSSRPVFEECALLARLGLMDASKRRAAELLSFRLEASLVQATIDIFHKHKDALGLVENLAAMFPRDADVRGHLAHAYAAQGYWHVAARLFEESTAMGGSYAYEAADLWRMAGDAHAAQRMNRQVESEKRRKAQAMSILFEAKNYAAVVALAPLTPAETADRYRLAYAHYAVGEYRRAEVLAKNLLATPYREAAETLLDSILRQRGQR